MSAWFNQQCIRLFLKKNVKLECVHASVHVCADKKCLIRCKRPPNGDEKSPVGDDRHWLEVSDPKWSERHLTGGNRPPFRYEEPPIGVRRNLIQGKNPPVGVERPLVGGEKPSTGGDRSLAGGDRSLIGSGHLSLEFIPPGGIFVLSGVITIHDCIKNKVLPSQVNSPYHKMVHRELHFLLFNFSHLVYQHFGYSRNNMF